MKNNRKKLNNGLIVMGKGERIAVISLLTMITILLTFCVLRPALPVSGTEEHAFHNLDSMIALRERAARENPPESSYGSASEASSRSSSGRASGPSSGISTSRDSGTSTGNSSRRTSRTTSSRRTTGTASGNSPGRPTTGSSSPRPAIPILDINTADSLQLVALPQIGEVMASRIHRYRYRLGGFVSLDQLFEIRGMDSARFEVISPYIMLENNEITKINVNRDEFRTLLRHPYLEYEQVCAIVNHRERRGLIQHWEQLKEITGDVNPLLESYISY